MKKKLFRVIILICVFSILISGVHASTFASNQLASYEADVVHLGNGELEILVSVFAVDRMDILGASNIFVYQQFGNTWSIIASAGTNYPGMTTSDSSIHEDYVYINTVEDTYLKVEVVIYAKDYSGESDARVLTYYVYT